MSDTADRELTVRYDASDVRYAAQFVVQASAEELIVNFAAGQIEDAARGQMLLPIHTRIALTPAGVQRLITTLQSALAQMAPLTRAPAATEARIPGLTVEHAPRRS